MSHHHDKDITLTTGPVWRNPNTDFVIVSMLNQSDKPQEVTVSILDWTTCDHPEYGKFAYTCGNAPSSVDESSDESSSSSDDESSSSSSSSDESSNSEDGSSPVLAAPADPSPCEPLSDPTCCDPISSPECAPPLTFTPLTFTIQPQTTVTVYGTPRTPWVPPVPIFEVRVRIPFLPPVPVVPPSPMRVNVFGINAAGVPQEGNSIFHNLLVPPNPV
ncbi:hypothetical protein [Bacillus salipaludis]|uniref:Uncharacterized protein n=1 Tax=Bacillus salipaludis TaxID=2547811 RepID=A0AA90TWI5_9BACI|nr:hypothetical protein [Bacillus salipaludis]MDQ6600749.1 hypothetical protein [Bacillus salipaludis]